MNSPDMYDFTVYLMKLQLWRAANNSPRGQGHSYILSLLLAHNCIRILQENQLSNLRKHDFKYRCLHALVNADTGSLSPHIHLMFQNFIRVVLDMGVHCCFFIFLEKNEGRRRKNTIVDDSQQETSFPIHSTHEGQLTMWLDKPNLLKFYQHFIKG